MMSGKRKFKCDKCSNVFTAMDIEWHCTALSVPQRCPKCGSRHTYPYNPFSLFNLFSDKDLYRDIWKEMDEEEDNDGSVVITPL